ncbi:potassium-transporting ATPase subunit KdpC [Rothia nasimurium]|uniref:Potassium-transporting ATPase KdpC subunit n=1 Tax=Luteibacter anthropi TaxID=564369 RepID=A0A7X5UAI6_9GAMM|nr:potassium-transporting ATPase subunit KdpC [Luteibacter anthropi]NII06767.1 potassium-transporting ATPase subunit KdpC [Luteibacter anthropi]
MTSSLVRPVLVSAVLFMAVTGLGYPLASTALAKAFFPRQASGSLVTHGGATIGSTVIGQDFHRPDYFHPRPSITGNTSYDAASSGASNLGPTSRKLLDSVRDRADAYRKENGLAADAPVPVDAVTASASGLDPDITLANAHAQAARVARQRHLPLPRVVALIDAQATGRQLGLLGEPRVNVLALNLALDATASGGTP